MHADAAAIDDPEGAALLDWFADGAMTLLGYEVERPYEAPSDALGIFSIPGAPTDEGGCLGAMRYFEQGGDVPLIAKAERKSTVHRRVPLDLVVVPIREKRQDHRHRRPCRPVDQRGADASRPRKCRCCARSSQQLDKDFGFDPRGHSGKALRHAVASLPRDLLVNLDPTRCASW